MGARVEGDVSERGLLMVEAALAGERDIVVCVEGAGEEAGCSKEKRVLRVW